MTKPMGVDMTDDQPSPVEKLLRNALAPNPPPDTVCKTFDVKRGKTDLMYCMLVCNNSKCPGPHEVGPSQAGVCDCCARAGLTGFGDMGLFGASRKKKAAP